MRPPSSTSTGHKPGRAIAIAVPCILLGIAGGVAMPRAARPRAAPSAAPTAAAAPRPEPSSLVVLGPTSARLADEDRAALREMIHEELAAERRAADAPGSATRGPADGRATPAPAPEQLASYDDARATVDRGLAAGTWTEGDRARLHASLSSLPTETLLEVTRPLLVAVNSGQVLFEGRGPLF